MKEPKGPNPITWYKSYEGVKRAYPNKKLNGILTIFNVQERDDGS